MAGKADLVNGIVDSGEWPWQGAAADVETDTLTIPTTPAPGGSLQLDPLG